jgi:hypothetical protein
MVEFMNKPFVKVFSPVIEIAPVEILVRVPYQGLSGEAPAGSISIQQQIYPSVLLHQGAASFQKSEGIKNKEIG